MDITLIIRHFPWVTSIDGPVVTSLCPLSVLALQLYSNAVSCLRTSMVQMGGPEMLTHHIAAFLSVALASFTGQAHLYTLLLLSTELTTPFVNARWIYDQMVRPSMFNLCWDTSVKAICSHLLTRCMPPIVPEIPLSAQCIIWVSCYAGLEVSTYLQSEWNLSVCQLAVRQDYSVWVVLQAYVGSSN